MCAINQELGIRKGLGACCSSIESQKLEVPSSLLLMVISSLSEEWRKDLILSPALKPRRGEMLSCPSVAFPSYLHEDNAVVLASSES